MSFTDDGGQAHAVYRDFEMNYRNRRKGGGFITRWSASADFSRHGCGSFFDK